MAQANHPAKQILIEARSLIERGWCQIVGAQDQKGMHRDVRKPWKQLRKTQHDHNPVNDAKGNAEVLLMMAKDVKGLVRV